ncbi:MAG TPA: hypothetical protein VLC93_15350, partial [Myxococcota bacterium]|nr:hypothetical protein [Myxococcota bacterium]
MTTTPESIAEHILRSDLEGKRRYDSASVRHVLPLIVLQGGYPPGVNPRVDTIMRDFAEAAGITPKMSARAMTKAINEYYKGHPPNPELMAEVSEGVQAIVMTRIGAESARHLRTH